MDISSEVKDNITVVRFEGNLDTNTSTDAQDYLNNAIDESTKARPRSSSASTRSTSSAVPGCACCSRRPRSSEGAGEV
jgi:hypothetical protein